jgi:hypothetical protein
MKTIENFFNSISNEHRLKTKYTFLTNVWTKEIFAVESNRIKTERLCDLYDQRGNKFGHFRANDFCLENGDEAMSWLVISIAKNFNIDDESILINYDERNKFFIERSCCTSDEQQFQINNFIWDWRKENEKFVMADAITYFDGEKWQSEILNIYDYRKQSWFQDFEPDLYILDDEDLVELQDAITNKTSEYVIENGQTNKDFYDYVLYKK